MPPVKRDDRRQSLHLPQKRDQVLFLLDFARVPVPIAHARILTSENVIFLVGIRCRFKAAVGV